MPKLCLKLQYSQLQDSTTNGRKFQEITVSLIFYVCECITNMSRLLVKEVNIYIRKFFTSGFGTDSMRCGRPIVTTCEGSLALVI